MTDATASKKAGGTTPDPLECGFRNDKGKPPMHLKRLKVSSFEIRSLALFASLAMGSGYAAAQFTVGPPAKPPAAAAQTTQEAIPANSWTPTQIADAFRKTDSDGNGSISRQEAEKSSGLARNFDKVDTNADGMLSRQEFEQSLK